MNVISITLSDDGLSKLKQQAEQLGVTPEELARRGVEALLSKPDDRFEQAVKRTLQKNTELYKRLA